MSEEQKEMQVEAAEKAAKKVAPVTTAEPEENFDWDAYENDAVVPASEKDALTQKYAETLSKVGEKEVVEGTVISMNKREVVVNIGYKSDGIISLNEFRYNPELKVGDKVEEGQTLVIIEAMKLMNEIKSEYSGTIKSILVKNEELVEYGQPLFVLV